MNTFGRGISRVLYVLECDEEKYLKIGICKDYDQVLKRIKTLQTGNPKKINLLHWEERDSAKDAELYLHNSFSSYRVSGEWFEGITLHKIRSKLMMFHDQF